MRIIKKMYINLALIENEVSGKSVHITFLK